MSTLIDSVHQNGSENPNLDRQEPPIEWVDRVRSHTVGAPIVRHDGPAGAPPLIAQILAARGLTNPDDIRKWIAPSLRDLREPMRLRDMDKAVARLVLARERQESVCIYADYDLDGTSACALLRRALEWLGFERLSHYQPSRLKEGYGLHAEALQRLSASGVSLVVTVDLGITAIEEAEVARELGVDLIITDHHLPKDRLPNALAVVNPNRGNCDSGLGHLCGTGVAFYLALALRRSLLESGAIEVGFDPKALLDCFVIGTLTDMVPLIAENRALTMHGLIALASTQRPGLRVLLQELGLWGIPLTAQDVAIRFAPKLNALSRLEHGLRPLDLYLVASEAEAQALVADVLSSNQTRIALQREAETIALDEAKASPQQGCVVIARREFHQGVVGLVATKACQQFGLPAFVGAIAESGVVIGSARAPDGVNVLEAMEAASDVLIQFGGHAAAAGFEVEAARVPELRERLRAFFMARSSETKAVTKSYDVECRLEDLNADLMSWHDRLAPFGAQFPLPVFRVKDVRVAGVRMLKGGHLRLTLASARDKASAPLTAVWFSPPSRRHDVAALGAGAQIEALVELQWNWFRGQKSLQLMVLDVRELGSPSLEARFEKSRVEARV